MHAHVHTHALAFVHIQAYALITNDLLHLRMCVMHPAQFILSHGDISPREGVFKHAKQTLNTCVLTHHPPTETVPAAFAHVL